MSSPVPAFRTPATPTLQDGSLPFVSFQLRNAMSQMNRPPETRLPLGSPAGASDGGNVNPPPDLPPYISTSLASSHLGSVSKKNQLNLFVILLI